MTPREFVRNLAPVELDRLALIFNFLADHGYELTLESGLGLRDATDFIAFHREMAMALKFSQSTEVSNGPVFGTATKVTYPLTGSRFDLSHCPDCGHVHIEDDECGFPTGGGRICRCERTAVSA